MVRKIPLKDLSNDHGPTRDEILAEIRRLYFQTKKGTIERDFDRAIDLLKALPTVEDRQRAHVYMEGLAEMRKEWGRGKLRMTNDE